VKVHFIVTTLKDWTPGQPGRSFKTIEAAEEYLQEEAGETVGKFLSKFYVHQVLVGNTLVYSPEIVLNVTTPEEESGSTDEG
jgi:hypothetical protein